LKIKIENQEMFEQLSKRDSKSRISEGARLGLIKGNREKHNFGIYGYS